MSTSALWLGVSRARAVSAVLALMLAAGNAVGQNGFAGRWEPTLGTGPAGEVRASVMFDVNGTGAVPVVGTASSGQVMFLQGGEWKALGRSFGNADINALVVFDPDGDGPAPAQLIAAGSFMYVQSATPPLVNTVNRVAKWTGVEWVPLGQGLGDAVYALGVWDPDGAGPQPPQLIAGGKFRSQPFSPIGLNGVARWNGTSWQPLGSGMSITGGTAEVDALATFDPDGDGPLGARLIAGGTFTGAGGVAANNVASWDGAVWSPLGDGLTGGSPQAGAGVVSALLADDPDGAGPLPARLVAGGVLKTADGVPAGGIAEWDGVSWTPIGAEDLSRVFSLRRFDPDGEGPLPSRLIAAKDGTAASPAVAGCVVAWNGSSWQPVGGGVEPGQPTRNARTLLVSGPAGAHALIAGGNFRSAGSVWAPEVAQWDGAAWLRLASERSGQALRDVAVFDGDGAGPAPSQLVTLGSGLLGWSGSGWQAIEATYAPGFPPSTLEVYGPETPGGAQRLVVGGWSFDEEQQRVGTAYRQEGAAWEPFGPPGLTVMRLVMVDADGEGPTPARAVVTDSRGVYEWNGAGWTQLGGVANGTGMIGALAVFDPDGPGAQTGQLVVAGTFTSIGGVPLANVARWDGAAWQPLGGGLGGAVSALAVYDVDGDGPRSPLLIAG